VLLAVDVGNTNVTFALFDGERLAADWRVTAHRERTADEMAVELRELFSLKGLDLTVVTGVVISSVVPNLNAALRIRRRSGPIASPTRSPHSRSTADPWS